MKHLWLAFKLCHERGTTRELVGWVVSAALFSWLGPVVWGWIVVGLVIFYAGFVIFLATKLAEK